MTTFLVGLTCFIIGGCVGTVIMSMMVVASKSDDFLIGDEQYNEH